MPAYRGESSNYRYYIESQIAEILLLKELRELKFPVKVIWKLFSDRNLKGLEEELERRMGELRVEQDELQKRYDKTLEFFLGWSGEVFLLRRRRVRILSLNLTQFKSYDFTKDMWYTPVIGAS